MKKFDPRNFGFKKLDLQNGSLCFYEYQSGEFCDGKMDPHRINTYLTQDGDFVTVWHGLFDPAFIDQAFLDLVEKAGLEAFDFASSYNTQLLQAYIKTCEQAEIILKSLRYEKMLPSLLRIDEDNRITCDSLGIKHK
jgi:hypothetical protein